MTRRQLRILVGVTASLVAVTATLLWTSREDGLQVDTATDSTTTSRPETTTSLPATTTSSTSTTKPTGSTTTLASASTSTPPATSTTATATGTNGEAAGETTTTSAPEDATTTTAAATTTTTAPPSDGPAAWTAAGAATVDGTLTWPTESNASFSIALDQAYSEVVGGTFVPFTIRLRNQGSEPVTLTVSSTAAAGQSGNTLFRPVEWDGPCRQDIPGFSCSGVTVPANGDVALSVLMAVAVVSGPLDAWSVITASRPIEVAPPGSPPITGFTAGTAFRVRIQTNTTAVIARPAPSGGVELAVTGLAFDSAYSVRIGDSVRYDGVLTRAGDPAIGSMFPLRLPVPPCATGTTTVEVRGTARNGAPTVMTTTVAAAAGGPAAMLGSTGLAPAPVLVSSC